MVDFEGEMRVDVSLKDAAALRKHAKACPLCQDEVYGTRGCPRFEGTVESLMLELTETLLSEEVRDGEE